LFGKPFCSYAFEIVSPMFPQSINAQEPPSDKDSEGALRVEFSLEFLILNPVVYVPEFVFRIE